MEVKEEQDHPPTADSGEDITTHLPKHQATLLGKGSSDDHGIYDNNFRLLMILHETLDS